MQKSINKIGKSVGFLFNFIIRKLYQWTCAHILDWGGGKKNITWLTISSNWYRWSFIFFTISDFRREVTHCFIYLFTKLKKKSGLKPVHGCVLVYFIGRVDTLCTSLWRWRGLYTVTNAGKNNDNNNRMICHSCGEKEGVSLF